MFAQVGLSEFILSPSLLHFGLLVGTTLRGEAHQDVQNAARTPKPPPDTDLQRFLRVLVCWLAHSFLRSFVLLFACFVYKDFLILSNCTNHERSAQASEASAAREAIKTHAYY